MTTRLDATRLTRLSVSLERLSGCEPFPTDVQCCISPSGSSLVDFNQTSILDVDAAEARATSEWLVPAVVAAGILAVVLLVAGVVCFARARRAHDDDDDAFVTTAMSSRRHDSAASSTRSMHRSRRGTRRGNSMRL